MDFQQMDKLVNQLRCSRCNEYLYNPPIVLLSDSTSACGYCVPPLPPVNADGSVVRQLILEQVLRRLSFPCKYKPGGCKERNYFGYANHDEEACVYRPLECPTEECPWSGPMFEIPKHFSEAHSAMVKRDLDFKLNVASVGVGECFQGTILAVVNQVPVLVKYSYNVDYFDLYSEINCLTLDKVSCKVWMFNDSKDDCAISIKGEECVPYISKRCHGSSLMLQKYIPVLENPDCIYVSIQVEKGDGNRAVMPARAEAARMNTSFRGLPLPCLDEKPVMRVRQNCSDNRNPGKRSHHQSCH